MNILGWALIILVAAIFSSLIAVSSAQTTRFGRFVNITTILCMIVSSIIISTVASNQNGKLESATVPRLNQATNGLYEVLATYKNTDGGTLAILHPAKITHIDVTERRVASLKFGSPQLLTIDHPIASPQSTNSGIFTGFVEIMGEGKNKVIQTFRPFPATQ